MTEQPFKPTFYSTNNNLSTKLTLKTPDSIQNDIFPQNSFIYQNNYMAKTIKFVFKKNNNPPLSTLKKKHQRSNTLSQFPNPQKSKLQLDTLTNLLSNTGILNNTRQSTFYNKRSISTISHNELIKDIAFKNMNNLNSKGNELRAKFKLDQNQIDDLLVSAKKPFLIKEIPARHQNADSLNLKNLEKYKKILEQKTFENDRKQENFDNDFVGNDQRQESQNDRIFALTHHHIQKKWGENVDPLPQIIQTTTVVKKKKEKRFLNRKIKIIHRTEKKPYSGLDFIDKLEMGSAGDLYKIGSNIDLLANLTEENFPQYNKELGPSSKFLNLESLNKQKKKKDQMNEIIKRKSILMNPSDLAKSQSIMLNQKISALLQNTNDGKRLLDDGEISYKSDEEKPEDVIKRNATNTKRGIELRKSLKEALHYLAKLKLDLRDLQTHKIFSSKPYEKPYSFEFISACKHSNQFRVQELLFFNKYLVYDFDYVYLTALHWAAKRGEFEIAKILIKFGSDLNAKDLIGRTPLYIAIQHNKMEIMQLLLFNQASAWSTKLCDYKPLCAKNPLAGKILTRSRQLDILIKMTPPRLRKALWQKDAWTILMNSNGKDEALLRRIMA